MSRHRSARLASIDDATRTTDVYERFPVHAWASPSLDEGSSPRMDRFMTVVMLIFIYSSMTCLLTQKLPRCQGMLRYCTMSVADQIEDRVCWRPNSRATVARRRCGMCVREEVVYWSSRGYPMALNIKANVSQSGRWGGRLVQAGEVITRDDNRTSRLWNSYPVSPDLQYRHLPDSYWLSRL